MFRDPLRKSAVTSLLTVIALASAGCGLNPGTANLGSGELQPAVVSHPTISGHLQGGYYPVANASVQLWYPGVTGYGSASNLLATTKSDAGGSFSFSSTPYTCPATDMPLYITATGGNPGLSSTTNWTSSTGNSYLAVAAYIGQCNGATALTGLIVNEVTTVGLAFATSQFTSASQAGGKNSGDVAATTINSVSGTTAANGGNIGAPVGTVTGGVLTVTNALAYTNLKNAFATVNNLVNVDTGTAGPVNSADIGNDGVGPYSTKAKINTLANIIASCTQSDGVAADNPSCANLAAIGTGVTPTGKTVPTDTFQMMLYLALSPTTNISAVYNFQAAQALFQPALAVAPFDWTLGIGYTGPQTAVTGATATYALLAPAVDQKGQVWMAATAAGGLFAVGPTGSPLNGGAPYADSGAYSGPTETTIDASGNVWVADAGSASNSIIEYNPTANTYAKYSGNTSPTCGPSGLTLDPNYNFLFTCVKETGTPNPAYPLNALLNTGTVAIPAYTATSLVGNTATAATGQVVQIASDPSGNIWVPISSTTAAVVEMTPSPSVSAPTTYTAVSTNEGKTAGTGGGVVIDHAGQVWFDATQTSLSKVSGGTVTNYTGSGATGGGQLNSALMAIDGAGDIWMANTSGTILGTGSSAVKYFTVSEYNNNGVAITPPNTSTQPGGYAHDIGQPKYVAVDGSGNVWVPNYQASGLITSYQITGANAITINGSTTVLTATLFPTSNGYVTLSGFPTSTFLNGMTFIVATDSTAGSFTLTEVGNTTLTPGSTVTENGFVNLGSGIAPAVTEIVGVAAPVFTPLGTAAALNKQAVLP